MATLEMTLAELSADLEAQARRLDKPDLTRAMRSCALAAKASVMDNFAGQHAPDGTPWPPRKRQRNRKRDKRARKKGGQQQLLQDRGLFRASYQSGEGHVEEVGPLSLAVGSNLKAGDSDFTLAEIHTFGTRTIPAREQIGWGEPLVETVTEIVADHLARQLGG